MQKKSQQQPSIRHRGALATTLLFCLVPVLAVADECRYEKPIAFELSADSIRELAVEAGAGSLRISATTSGADTIAVSATACADSRDELADLDVLQVREGDVLTLSTQIPEYRSSFWGRDAPRIHLDITVPANLALAIEDGSGSMEVSGVGPVRIEDGSGSVTLTDIAGNLTLRDDSGSVRIHNVAGDVRVEDGSGSLEVTSVTGNVDIDDGSGSMQVAQVGGSVGIRDGSGSIDVSDVALAVTILEDGSGSVNTRRVNHQAVGSTASR